METTRNLGFAAWDDKQAWMEAMKGPGWTAVLQEEHLRFKNYVSRTPGIKEIERELSFLEPKETTGYFETENQELRIVPSGTLNYKWRYVNSDTKTYESAADLDAKKGGYLWTVKDVGSGAESYQCEYRHLNKKTWTKDNVGPFVGVYKDRCYLIEADRLWYHTLISVDAKTGSGRRVHYKETDPEWNLTLLRLQDKSLCLVGNNAGNQKLWVVREKDVIQMYPNGAAFVPVTSNTAFVRDDDSDVYEPKGSALTEFRFPSFRKETPEWMSIGRRLLVTRAMGERTLWKLSHSKKPELLKKVLGSFMPDPWASDTLLLAEPGTPFYIYRDSFEPHYYANSSKHVTTSKDGTEVTIVCVTAKGKHHSKALLVNGYGAYGLPTHMSTGRWKPLLDRGWSIAFALIRGSGDDTDSWAEAGRRDQKVKSMEDFEACISKAQEVTGVEAKNTVIYGRSAGGYLVGATLGQHVAGDLFGAAYTEVPYVDVLRTTTNPKLPLTKLEYEEFGHPAKKLQNFGALLHLSPVDLVPESGVPRIFVLCRTALLDLEVLAYESVKWIQKLRGPKEARTRAGQPKLLAITAGEGHFAKGPTALRQRAEDLAILDAWTSASRKKSKTRIYKMLGGRRNRRNNTMRKNRRNNNAAMMGGKRRGRKGTRRGRGRKGTRRAHRKH